MTSNSLVWCVRVLRLHFQFIVRSAFATYTFWDRVAAIFILWIYDRRLIKVSFIHTHDAPNDDNQPIEEARERKNILLNEKKEI